MSWIIVTKPKGDPELAAVLMDLEENSQQKHSENHIISVKWQEEWTNTDEVGLNSQVHFQNSKKTRKIMLQQHYYI